MGHPFVSVRICVLSFPRSVGSAVGGWMGYPSPSLAACALRKRTFPGSAFPSVRVPSIDVRVVRTVYRPTAPVPRQAPPSGETGRGHNGSPVFWCPGVRPRNARVPRWRAYRASLQRRRRDQRDRRECAHRVRADVLEVRRARLCVPRHSDFPLSQLLGTSKVLSRHSRLFELAVTVESSEAQRGAQGR